MGFMDLFNKGKRELMLARIDYERCNDDRRHRLDSFRKKAFEELSFKHPNGNFLINRLNPEFMFYNRTNRKIYVGQFADYYAPFLHYVSQEADIHELHNAIAYYKYQTDRCSGVISPDALKRLKDRSGFRSNTWVDGFKTKGFVVTGSFDLEWFYGGSLFLNGRLFAKSSVWEPKPSGYFAGRIYEEIIKSKIQTTTGFSSLVFVTGKCHSNYGPMKLHYEIIFANGQNYADPKNNSEFRKTIIDLRNFINEIEAELSTQGDENDKDDFTPDYGRDYLNSDEKPPQDESIESYYPF